MPSNDAKLTIPLHCAATKAKVEQDLQDNGNFYGVQTPNAMRTWLSRVEKKAQMISTKMLSMSTSGKMECLRDNFCGDNMEYFELTKDPITTAAAADLRRKEHTLQGLHMQNSPLAIGLYSAQVKCVFVFSFFLQKKKNLSFFIFLEMTSDTLQSISLCFTQCIECAPREHGHRAEIRWRHFSARSQLQYDIADQGG